MSIDLSEATTAIPHVVDAVRRHAGEGVDGALDAARSARRDVGRTVRDVERTVGRRARRIQARTDAVLPRRRSRFTTQQIVVTVLVISGLVAVAAIVTRRARAGALASGDHDDAVAGRRDDIDVATHDGAAGALLAP